MPQRGQTEREKNPANPLGAPLPRAADPGARGATAERIGFSRAVRIMARVNTIDATRPVVEVLSGRVAGPRCVGSTQENTPMR
jgi:hypothetical protein